MRIQIRRVVLEDYEYWYNVIKEALLNKKVNVDDEDDTDIEDEYYFDELSSMLPIDNSTDIIEYGA